MPFGDKKDIDGQEIDFDDIYRFFFRKAIEAIKEPKVECIRCDDIAESGSIHHKMIEHIYESDVVVVDITTNNPNVFYELGVRHALKQTVTVLIRREGTRIPFNIQGFHVVSYDQKKFASIEKAKKEIADLIENGLRTKKNDSLVHNVLDLKIGSAQEPIKDKEEYTFTLKDNPKKAIGLITGDIQNVTEIDVWVNSENTNMQMSRHYENSISGIIRYLGAEKQDEQVKVDTIGSLLDAKMKEGNWLSVNPGTVLETGPGELGKTHNVKRIFHAAAVYGQVGKGYFPIPDVAKCVRSALKKMDELRDPGLRSILFPLLGTGTARGGLEESAKELLGEAIRCLRKAKPESTIEKVCFLAYSKKDLEVCLDILQSDSYLAFKEPGPNPAAAAPPAVKATDGDRAAPPDAAREPATRRVPSNEKPSKKASKSSK
jgi:O-acetyl-ADP-ribose deacetylase (regulator of RNase III)